MFETLNIKTERERVNEIKKKNKIKCLTNEKKKKGKINKRKIRETQFIYEVTGEI